MRTLIDRVRRLTLGDYALVTEVVTLAVVIELALRFAPYSRVQKRFAEGGPASPESPTNPHLYHRLARFTAAAYRALPFPTTCLRQSLVLCALLNRRGAKPVLHVGVTKDGDVLSAHAWVECDGVEPPAADSPFQELRRVAVDTSVQCACARD